MTLTDKEQQTARIVGILVAIIVVFGGTWYWYSKHQDLKLQIAKAINDNNKINDQIKNGNIKKAEFAARLHDKMEGGQLAAIGIPQLEPADYKKDASKLDVTNWLAKISNAFNNHGMLFTTFSILPSTRALQAANSADFRVAHFQISTTDTTTRALAGFLQYIENARFPVRLETLLISTPSPGQDKLDVTFNFDVLIYAPPTKDAKVNLAEKLPPTSTTRPSGSTPSRSGAVTTPVLSPGAALSADEEQKIVDKFKAARLKENQDLDSYLKVHPPKTPEEIAADKAAAEELRKQEAARMEAEMIKRHQEQEQALATQRATQPAPAPSTPNTPGGGDPGNNLNPGGNP